MRGRLAQLVEQLTLNQWVIGSNPIAPTTKPLNFVVFLFISPLVLCDKISHLVSKGLSLSVVGRLLGHTQASTTQAASSHLADEPLREAAELFGKQFDLKTKSEKEKALP
jgi:hypothetical protein